TEDLGDEELCGLGGALGVSPQGGGNTALPERALATRVGAPGALRRERRRRPVLVLADRADDRAGRGYGRRRDVAGHRVQLGRHERVGDGLLGSRVVPARPASVGRRRVPDVLMDPALEHELWTVMVAVRWIDA